MQPSLFLQVNYVRCFGDIRYAIVLLMNAGFESLPSGTITSPRGFYAGATYSHLKKETGDALDLGILSSKVPCTSAGVFTLNRIKAASVLLSQQRLASGRATALVVNSGCANASTGEAGFSDAIEMANLAASVLGISGDEVLVASTGVIGQRLPIDRIKENICNIELSSDGGHELARAIMTTDTVPKEIAIAAGGNNDRFIIGGIAKGAGMIHPNMATMLSFLATDAKVDAAFLKSALTKAVDKSFNMISIDGDTSPNDTVLIMANGMAGNEQISDGSSLSDAFQQALEQVCLYLAKSIARDGEGATKLIEVTVSGALTVADARLTARTIVSSPLVKAAIYGNDPNWGRIVVAAGRCGAELVESKLELHIGDIHLVRSGRPCPFDKAEVARVLAQEEVPIHLNLNLGTAMAQAWGCDLSEEYVTINSAYTT